MKVKFSFSKLIDSNKFILVLSVLIAVVAWLVVSITQDDTQIKSVAGIPLNTKMEGSTPERLGLSLIEGGDQTITVKVEGVGVDIGGLSADDFVAKPDWTTVTKSGEQSVKVVVSPLVPSSNYHLVQDTFYLVMDFDQLETRTYDLIPVADKVKAADGFRKDVLTATPSQIELTGPKSELDLIVRCTVEDPEEKTSDQTIVVEKGVLGFYKANGEKLTKNEMAHVVVPQQSYSLTIPIYMQKVLPVKVEFINNYSKLDTAMLPYALSDESISVAGPKALLENMTEITVGPIDFTKIDVGSVFTLDVSLPGGLINEDQIRQVTVSFDAELLDRKNLTINGANILRRNIPSGMKVEVLSDSIRNVRMVGLVDDVDKLTAEDLVAQVDLSGITEEGTAKVRASIFTTGNKYAWAVGEYYVQVKVERIAE